MLDEIIAEIVENRMAEMDAADRWSYFLKFLEDKELEEKAIETLFQKANFFVTRTPQASCSESIFYDSSGYNYTQLNLSGRIGGIWIKETRYKEATFPEDLDHGGEWKGSVESWKKNLTLNDFKERVKQKGIFKWASESLVKIIEQHNFLHELEIKESEPRVCLYLVEEVENLMEYDNPVGGVTFDVVTKTREYKYFYSKEKALTFIGKRREQYQNNNSSLKLGVNYYNRESLVGKTNHYYGHELQIIHNIHWLGLFLSEFSKQHLSLLRHPEPGRTTEKIGTESRV